MDGHDRDNVGSKLLSRLAETAAMPSPIGASGQNLLQFGSKLTVPGKQRDRKQQPFNRDFKQAVFQRRGTEDGSSQLHVSFSSFGGKAVVKPVVTTSVAPQKPKSKLSSGHYKDIVHVDKKKIQEEVDNLPKPEHLMAAETELLSVDGVLKFEPENKCSEGFRCQGCLDVFPSQFSLADHLDRMSYSLNFSCQDCGLRQTFFNKCALYTHIATHKPVDKTLFQTIAANCTTLAVLPRSQLKPTSISAASSSLIAALSSEPQLNGHASKMASLVIDATKNAMDPPSAEAGKRPSVDGVNQTVEHGGSKATVTADLTEDSQTGDDCSLLPDTSHQPAAGTDADDDDDGEDSRTCTECSRKFETEWTLRTHFNLPVDGEEAPAICVPCHIELPTACSYKAHIRLHSLTEPFTCPDCGITMGKKQTFLKHLRLQCLHYSKLSEYICPGCPETFLHADEQLKHLQALPQHLRFDGEKSYYKCNGCPKAFKSVAAHSKHESCPGAGCTMVHMCNNCKQQTVFRSWPELMDHRSVAHPDLKYVPKRSRVYACYLCTHKSRSKQGFLDHLLKSHGKKKIEHMCEYCGVEVDSLQSLDTHKSSCLFKKSQSSSRPSMIRERVPKLSSSSSVNSDSSSAVNGRRESCAATATQESQGPPSDLVYMSYKPSFNCHVCLAECTNYAQLRAHVQRKHGGQGLIYECWLCRDRGNSSNFFKQSTLDKHMVDVHKMQITELSANLAVNGDGLQYAEQEGADEEDLGETPPKRMKIWGDDEQEYECCRCEFKSSAVEEFKEHIKQHKQTAESHQCAECGMCFPVQLALKRHLFAVHKVTDYAKYSRHQYMIEYEKQLNDSQGKCPVCSKQFDDDSQFKKHLRTHGMMYINTKCLPCNT